MSLPEWSLIAGIATSVVLAVGPWMFMVHAELAVIATKAADLCNKVDQLTDEHRQLWDLSTRHSARLDAQQLQLAQLVNHFRKD